MKRTEREPRDAPTERTVLLVRRRTRPNRRVEESRERARGVVSKRETEDRLERGRRTAKTAEPSGRAGRKARQKRERDRQKETEETKGEKERAIERERTNRLGQRRERDECICVLKQTFDQSADCCQSYVATAYPSVPVARPRIQFCVFTRRGNQRSRSSHVSRTRKNTQPKLS